ncbi:MAG: DUF4224 domain-containing protein [Gammaproteobacteria bacterium]|nr:DUF4224 domain-containing protein [Gammaproteobacteria bacterium]
MDRFLTDVELHEATGAVQPAKQAEILARHGIFFIRRLDGAVRVTWFSLNHPASALSRATTEPDFSGVLKDGPKSSARR